jgi:hypothetical protein
MIRLLTAVTALVLGPLALAPGQGPPGRDVIVIGEQRYVHTQQVPHDLGVGISDYVVISARGGRAAYCALLHDALEIAYLRQFDTWGNPCHEPVPFDAASPAGFYCRCTCAWPGAWVLWENEAGDSLVRIFDTLGSPVGSPIVVANALTWYQPVNLAVSMDRAAPVFRELISGSYVQFDLHMRVLGPDGTPLTNLFPVANTSESEEGGSLTFLPDGDIVVGYIAGNRHTHVWHPYLRRVHPDGSVDDRVLVTPEEATGTYVRLLDDGSLLVRYLPAPDGSAQVLQRFGTDFQPLADPIEINPSLLIMASTGDGRVAIASVFGDRIWMQMYDAAWQPVSDQFEPLGEPPPSRSFIGTSTPLAYDDNGTVWLAWTELASDIEVAHLTTLTPFEPGDMNYDRRVDNFDITPFVMALADPAEYRAHYPGLPYEFLGDVNEDGVFDNFDITPFVHLLVGK